MNTQHHNIPSFCDTDMLKEVRERGIIAGIQWMKSQSIDIINAYSVVCDKSNNMLQDISNIDPDEYFINNR